MRRIAILDAPSNLGLRPPTETSVPGCAKAPGALRDHGLVGRLHARDAGCLTPPRYDPGDWRPGDGVCQAPEIAAYSRRLADRIGAIIDAGEFPVVLGGDCSIVIGSGLAMHRLGEDIGGRIGLVFVDGHSDFRHPGNASYVGAAAGEDLALVTGRGQTDLAAIEGRRPYFRDIDVVVMGIRAQDEYRLDLQAAGIVTRPVPALRVEGAARSAQWAREQLVDCAGYWVHLDLDVLDPAVLPAVDAPSPGGIAFPELEILLAGLVDTPHCLGVEITVFDPDYDTDGGYAEEITTALVAGLSPVRTVTARPDLAAARRDLAPRAEDPGRDPVQERRAAAAGAGVAFAAAAMSGGGSLPGTPGEAAAPAVTLHAVEAAEVPLAADDALPEGVAVPEDPAPWGEAGLSEGDVPLREDPPRRDDAALKDDALPEDDAPGEDDAPVEDDAPGEDDALPEGGALLREDARLEGDEFSAGDALLAGDALVWADRVGGPEAAVEGVALSAADRTWESGTAVAADRVWRHEAAVEADRGWGPGDVAVRGADLPTARSDPETDPARSDSETDPARSDSETDPARSDSGTDPARYGDLTLDHPAPREPADRRIGPGPDGPQTLAGTGSPGVPPVVPRPLGTAPLLDSEPLPATRPGMLRPRTHEQGFTLPAQRPAFDLGPEEPADVS